MYKPDGGLAHYMEILEYFVHVGSPLERFVPVLRSVFEVLGRHFEREFTAESIQCFRIRWSDYYKRFNHVSTFQEMEQFRAEFFVFLDELFPIKLREKVIYEM